MSDSRFLFKNFAVPVTWLQLGLGRSTAPHGLSTSSGPTTVQGGASNSVASKITQLAY
jgi:hypothetical protein